MWLNRFVECVMYTCSCVYEYMFTHTLQEKSCPLRGSLVRRGMTFLLYMYGDIDMSMSFDAFLDKYEEEISIRAAESGADQEVGFDIEDYELHCYSDYQNGSWCDS